jgi:hypothetical protein
MPLTQSMRYDALPQFPVGPKHAQQDMKKNIEWRSDSTMVQTRSVAILVKNWSVHRKRTAPARAARGFHILDSASCGTNSALYLLSGHDETDEERKLCFSRQILVHILV